MFALDLSTAYADALRFLMLALAVLLLISGLDDLIIDAAFWLRRTWRTLVIYRNRPPFDYRALYEPVEKPLAIMVPAWRETGVIGSMAELAATTLDYENYHIFVGTYPNDPDTQRDVDMVCAQFKNIHKVVCARPGPTSKADCLNNVLEAILQFERRANLQFAGFVLHDAEDVLSAMELRLFNYLVDRKDLIQLPVYPFERSWTEFTSGHYMDEFAENHGKDIPVREALTGQVPSAGVGTCFSRRAVMALLADGDGRAFDVQSLTEDYDIGFRLRAKGMTQIFVRFPVLTEQHALGSVAVGKSRRESSVICVREYFPTTLGTAVRQKARWIIGIVYQSLTTHGWTRDLPLNYFLWRDRKGGVTNFVSFLATLLLVQVVALWAYTLAVPDSTMLSRIFHQERWITVLLGTNLVLMTNRIAHRLYFVSRYYGAVEGLLSIPRLFWANLINFLANWRAISQIVRHGGARLVAWDKTSHEFPVLGEAARARRPLGEILMEQGALTVEELADALVRRVRGLNLGSSLVHTGVITTEQLAAAVAQQAGAAWEKVDHRALDSRLLDELPAELALRYAVLPLREEGRTLVLASERHVDRVSTAALARKLGRPVSYVIVPKGQVVMGLRRWYGRQEIDGDYQMFEEAIASGTLSGSFAEALWQQYVARQVLFTEVLVTLGHLDPAALNFVLLRHDGNSKRLGEYLVEEGILSVAVVEEALAVQRALQGSLRSMCEDARQLDMLDGSLREVTAR